MVAEDVAGEPVEELGVSGGRALEAEVIFGFDESAAEVAGPDAIDKDSRGEWVIG